MPGKTITEPCCICGKTKADGVKFGRFNDNVYCLKHLTQIRRHGYILPENKERNRLTTCCICGEKAKESINGKEYCHRHYMQIYHHGNILNKTIYDKNEYIDHDTYFECLTYDTKGNITGHVLIDNVYKDKLKNYKIYIAKHNQKIYAIINIDNHKYFLNRFLLNIHLDKFSFDKVVDHINGNSLDNRLENLRICTHSQNMKNIRKNKITGVNKLKDNTYYVRLTYNYKTYNLGKFDDYYVAVYERIKKEKELYKEYGPLSDLYYILDLSSPIEELHKILSDEV